MNVYSLVKADLKDILKPYLEMQTSSTTRRVCLPSNW